MEISKLAGLPAHPLFVHIPVMAIPLVALMVIAYALRPSWRAGLIYPTAALTLIAMVGTLFAAGSGEELEEMLPKDDQSSALLHQHTELGDQTKIIVLIFGAVTLLYLGIDWWNARQQRSEGTQTGPSPLVRYMMPLAIAAVLLGGLSTVWVVRTGHSGAKSVWSDVQAEAGTNGATTEESDDDD